MARIDSLRQVHTMSVPFLLLFLVLALTSTIVHANPYAAHATAPIQDLTSTEKFDAALLKAGRTSPLLLVHFHGRCSACGDMAQAYASAAERASKAEGADLVLRDVVFGRVDGKGNEGLMERYGVEGNGPSSADGAPSESEKKKQSKKNGGKSIQGYPILVFTKASAEPLIIPFEKDDDDDKKESSSDVDSKAKATAKADAILSFARDQIRAQSPAKTSNSIVQAAMKEGVLALNADTFHAVVEDETKDVFVKFYAPWCSHCKTLAPRYAKVATLFAQHPTCMVTTFNSDPPAERAIAKQHKIRGFPTLKFFPAKNNARTNATKAEPEVYRGARTPEALVQFLNERCGTEMVLPTMKEQMGSWVDSWKLKLGLGGGGGKDGRGREL
ncbi:hypothetical protein CF319_g4181 [Tilletia indica]|nr:hypothetical protein CF319_g4181 [Tilletia indica]